MLFLMQLSLASGTLPTMARTPLVCLGLLATLCFPLLVTAAINVTLPATAPDNSRPLASTLLSFSIEQDRWPDWTGVSSRNQFTFNALQNLARLTGTPPKIRVGADSEDHTVWSPSVTVCAFILSSSLVCEDVLESFLFVHHHVSSRCLKIVVVPALLICLSPL